MVTRKVDRCRVCRKPRMMWIPNRAYLIEDSHKSRRYSDLNTGRWIPGTCRCEAKKVKVA